MNFIANENCLTTFANEWQYYVFFESCEIWTFNFLCKSSRMKIFPSGYLLVLLIILILDKTKFGLYNTTIYFIAFPINFIFNVKMSRQLFQAYSKLTGMLLHISVCLNQLKIKNLIRSG